MYFNCKMRLEFCRTCEGNGKFGMGCLLWFGLASIIVPTALMSVRGVAPLSTMWTQIAMSAIAVKSSQICLDWINELDISNTLQQQRRWLINARPGDEPARRYDSKTVFRWNRRHIKKIWIKPRRSYRCGRRIRKYTDWRLLKINENRGLGHPVSHHLPTLKSD